MAGRRTSTRWVPAALAVALCAGCCAFGPSLPGGAGDSARPFADVPPPPGCKLVWSYVVEGDAHRYGTLLYKGRADQDEVTDSYERLMPREGWLFGEALRSGETVLRYTKRERPRERCDIIIGRPGWTGSRYIIVTVTGEHD